MFPPRFSVASSNRPAFTHYDYLVVGAGFAGAVLAERLAEGLNRRVLVIDRRPHLAGNAYDAPDPDSGVLLHRYGPHYFRTNSPRIVDYLGRFTEWQPAHYRVLAWTDGQFWPFPINLDTFEQLVGHPATPTEMAATLAKWRVPLDGPPRNSEEVIVSQVGRELYEKFFRGYTRKQWRRDPRDLDPSVCGRVPIRTDRDDRYVNDRFQQLPRDGYTRMFERMLDHPNIEVRLNADFREVHAQVRYGHLVYTGPVDEYFDHRFGPLPYRSLRFEPETLDRAWFQPAVQVNYPNEQDFTRIVEIKHVTGQRHLPRTTIMREYPQDYAPGREAYYPIPAPDARALYGRYEALAAREPNVSFVGRMATYRYYNMDQVVGMALAEFDKLAAPARCLIPVPS